MDGNVNVIVTDGSTFRGVDHNNNALTNFYLSKKLSFIFKFLAIL